MINEMTAEEKAHFEKIEAILTDEKNKERI